MKKPLILLPLVSAAFLASFTLAHGANVLSSWIGGDDGTFAWEHDANWTPSIDGMPYPNNGGGDFFLAVIGDTAGDRVIETHGAISVARFSFEKHSDEGSTTLKLGGNFTVENSRSIDGVMTKSTMNNYGTDVSRLVLDLNGYDFTVLQVAGEMGWLQNMTITGGGTYTIAQLYHDGNRDRATIGANVTININGGRYSQQFINMTWDASSTLKYSSNIEDVATVYHGGARAHGLGNLIIGDHANTVANGVALANTALYVQGNVSILSFDGATDGAASKFSFHNAGKIMVGGNFHDEGADDVDYGTGTLVFNGGRLVEKMLTTGRRNLSTSFSIGENASYEGNVRLGDHLTTTGKFALLKESRFNVDNFTLTAKTVDLQSSSTVLPTIAITFGLDASGLVEATETLMLERAVVDITYDGSGWEGGDLELFRFAALSGTASGLVINTGGLFTYDAVVVGGNSIYLTNVEVIPEPGMVSLLLAAGCGTLLYGAGRRRGNGRGGSDADAIA